MILSELFSDEFIYAAGWTLVHTLWQGAAIAGAAALTLALMRTSSPNKRYILAALSLVAIAGLAAGTFALLYSPQPHSTAESTLALHAYHTNLTYEAGMLAVSTDSATVPSSLVETVSFWLNTYMPALVTAWLCGMLFFAVKLSAELAYTSRLRYREIFPPSQHWRTRFDDLCKLAGVHKGIELAESALVQVPVVIGALKPIVLLPLGTFAGLPAQQIEAILAHEIAHIRRHDYIVNIIQTIACVLFFYHPAVWWLSSRMRIEREHCCDDMAVAVSGSPIALAKALVVLQERAMTPRTVLAATGHNKYQLLQRIRRIAGQPSERTTPVGRLVAVSLLLAALLVIGITTDSASASNAQETPVAPTASQQTQKDKTQAESSRERSAGTMGDGYKIEITMDTNNDGTDERVEAIVDTLGQFTALTINGKKIPPSEFAAYATLLEQLNEYHRQAMEDSERIDAEAEEAEKDMVRAQQEAEALEAQEAEAMEAEIRDEEIDAITAQADAMQVQIDEIATQADAMAESIEKRTEAMAESIEKRAEAIKELRKKRDKSNNPQEKERMNAELRAMRNQIEKESMELSTELEKLTSDLIDKEYQEYLQQQAAELQETIRTLTLKSGKNDLSPELMKSVHKEIAQALEQARKSIEESSKELKKHMKELEKQSQESATMARNTRETTQRALEQELLRDKLIASADAYDFQLLHDKLVINGKEQPQQVLEKYRKFLTERNQYKAGSKFTLRKSK